ncbi:hypothetical protein RJ639_026364, partial [Escallonia herrerae]
PEPADELAAAPLHAVPPVRLLLLLPAPLAADLEHLPSSTSTFTSSFFSPGRSTLITCGSGVSFQLTRGLATAAVSLPQLGALVTAPKPSNGSKMSREKGSKMLLRLPPKKLGIRAMFSFALDNKKRFSDR